MSSLLFARTALERGIFSGHPPAAGWAGVGVLHNPGPTGKLFSSATAQAFLFTSHYFKQRENEHIST